MASIVLKKNIRYRGKTFIVAYSRTWAFPTHAPIWETRADYRRMCAEGTFRDYHDSSAGGRCLKRNKGTKTNRNKGRLRHAGIMVKNLLGPGYAKLNAGVEGEVKHQILQSKQR